MSKAYTAALFRGTKKRLEEFKKEAEKKMEESTSAKRFDDECFFQGQLIAYDDVLRNMEGLIFELEEEVREERGLEKVKACEE